MKRIFTILAVLSFAASMAFAQTGAEHDARGNQINGDFFLELAKGDVVGHSVVYKFGHNAAVANGAWEGVHTLSSTFTFVTSAATVRVKAGNVNDTAAGSGARAITIEGLSSTGALQTEVLVTAGASASSVSAATYVRVFRIYVAPESAGAYGGVNTGIIVIENGTGGTDLISIAAGEGQSTYGAYTIPLGKTGYITHLTVEADGVKPANFRVWVREDILDNTSPYEPARILLHFDGIAGHATERPRTRILKLNELTDIWVEAYGSGAATEVSVDFEIILVDN